MRLHEELNIEFSDDNDGESAAEASSVTEWDPSTLSSYGWRVVTVELNLVLLERYGAKTDATNPWFFVSGDC